MVRQHARGFTLVEMLVALFALSLLAMLSWRGLDGMMRVQQQTEARADEVLGLQVGLAQWGADLDALVQLPQQNAIEWNGRVLRLTRSATTPQTQGLVVVGWTRRMDGGTSRWLRWQSPPLATRAELDEAWQRADVWSQSPGDAERAGEVAVAPLQDWQIFFFRSDAWTNPLSSDAVRSTPGLTGARGADAGGTRTANLPDGVRLILQLPPGTAISGEITRDWARPSLGGGKS